MGKRGWVRMRQQGMRRVRGRRGGDEVRRGREDWRGEEERIGGEGK